MNTLNRTPLFDLYKEMGVKTIDFGGWALPVQFSSILEEHHAVRHKAGIFDVSHMGEISVKGENSLAFLQRIMTNDVSLLKVGGAQYSAMCNENGGTIDDLIIYKKAEEEYLVVVNAANIQKDYEWFLAHLIQDVVVENVSDQYALLALQGPLAQVILQKLTPTPLETIKFFTFQDDIRVANVKALVARTGYTGEDGFEIYCAPNQVEHVWKSILEAGTQEGIKPCGLGARDTLRFEATLPLYGQELSSTISPLEAGIGFAVKTNKVVPFNGQAVLKQQREGGIPRKLVGIEMIERGIPRTHYPIYAGEQLIGEVTTGTQSPTLKKNIGLALIEKSYAVIGNEVTVEIRGKKVKAVIVATPFYKRNK
ncbi:MAG: glycine cleavage system aminomethyltransferase GcvT [Bacillaceae bacterium]